MVSFDIRDAVHSTITCERHCQVIAQRQQLAALIIEIVHELAALFAVLAHESLLEGENAS